MGNCFLYSRDRAIEVLQKCPSGSYLVRESRSDHPSLVLNMVVSGEVKSFKIEYTQEKDRFCIFDMEPFPSLSDLLQSCERGNIVSCEHCFVNFCINK